MRLLVTMPTKALIICIASTEIVTDHLPPAEPIVQLLNDKCPDYDHNNGRAIQLTRIADDPRVIKTHLPMNLLSDSALSKAKVGNICNVYPKLFRPNKLCHDKLP